MPPDFVMPERKKKKKVKIGKIDSEKNTKKLHSE